ncbi:MAG: Rieske (2Fe-2S) protein, partial [Candidatus Omnitrophica bacterium]|nr:Rieske (2Fe-2S) protein [Candidatus Omnitrophota bacterium]
MAAPASSTIPAPPPSQPGGVGGAIPQDRWRWLDERFGRRQFLLKAGWGLFWVFLGGWLLSNLRYLFPNVLYEPRLSFKAGKPEDYSLGVSEKWKKTQRAWFIRTEQGFYCFWAR